jgi:hypothetical protein
MIVDTMDLSLRGRCYIHVYKNAVFWDVSPCGFNLARRFGRACRYHLQGRRNMESIRQFLTPRLLFREREPWRWAGCGGGGVVRGMINGLRCGRGFKRLCTAGRHSSLAAGAPDGRPRSRYRVSCLEIS